MVLWHWTWVDGVKKIVCIETKITFSDDSSKFAPFVRSGSNLFRNWMMGEGGGTVGEADPARWLAEVLVCLGWPHVFAESDRGLGNFVGVFPILPLIVCYWWTAMCKSIVAINDHAEWLFFCFVNEATLFHSVFCSRACNGVLQCS